MHIRILNPNTTQAITDDLATLAARFAASGSTVDARSPATGTPSIESHVEEAIGAMGVIEQVAIGDREGVDGYVIACFGDTGLAAAREMTRAPVVGMTEAAFFAAAMVAARFSVITLPPRTRIHTERVLRETGMGERCTRVRAIDIPVLDLVTQGDAVATAFLDEARRALAEDDAEAIVLGCAGLGALVAPLTLALGVPVIDGVLAGLKWVEGLVTLGLGSSKRSSFAPPPVKGLSGAYAQLFPGRD